MQACSQPGQVWKLELSNSSLQTTLLWATSLVSIASLVKLVPSGITYLAIICTCVMCLVRFHIITLFSFLLFRHYAAVVASIHHLLMQSFLIILMMLIGFFLVGQSTEDYEKGFCMIFPCCYISSLFSV